MTTQHKHAEILRAIADGKEVEWLGGKDAWYIGTKEINPLSHPHLEWRIKPEKKVLRYRVAKMKNGETYWLITACENNYAEELQKDLRFIEWIHDWQIVEVK
jgi:hypothetical protein